MEEPENFVDHVHLIDCRPRQVGRMNAVKEWITALEAQGKRVVVIEMDSPRPPLLGALMAPIGDPDLDAVDVFRSKHPHLLKATKPTLLEMPLAGKTILTSSNPVDFRADALHRFLRDEAGLMNYSEPWMDMVSTVSIGKKWLEPIPEPVVKKEKNKLKFLDGLGYKKRKYGR